MLTVISPAKTLDFDTPAGTLSATQPEFLARSTGLVEDARALSQEDIQALMGVSENIAQLNHRRFMDWGEPFELGNAKQSILAFKGDVYTGLEASTLTEAQLSFAQGHLRILSGLYGLLRPLDLMQPYRLEMGLKFVNRGGKISTNSGVMPSQSRLIISSKTRPARCWSILHPTSISGRCSQTRWMPMSLRLSSRTSRATNTK